MRSQKSKSFWSNTPIPNQSPAVVIPNYSLAKTASHIAVYVPFFSAERNVNYVDKNESPNTSDVLGFDTSQPHFVDMTGTGITKDTVAFNHPIKV